MPRFEVVVVGGGIVGLAAARGLRAAAPDLKLAILEKEPEVGQHQSTRNSGVLHAGLAYAPGSRKAQLTRRGIRLMTEFCQEHGIAHEICGKLVVATHARQLPGLRALAERGGRNGLAGIRWLSPDEAREIEPHVQCAGAIHVPEEGIVDFGGVCRALAGQLRAAGVEIRTDEEVRGVQREAGGWRIRTPRREYLAGFVVNCAGLHVDRVLAMTGERSPCRIMPFRGEYYRLRPEREALVRNLIYPVADPAFPFLGVHFTRRIAGGVEAGPNAVLALAREGYRRTDVRARDLAEAIIFPGLWRFAVRHARMAAREIGQSLSKRRFLAGLQELVPSVQDEDLVPGGAGVRAQAMRSSGALVEDFLWVERPRALHILNAPSPAATAALAIGEEIAGRVLLSTHRNVISAAGEEGTR